MKRNFLTFYAVLAAGFMLNSVASANDQKGQLETKDQYQTQIDSHNASKYINIKSNQKSLTDSQVKSLLIGNWRASIFEYNQRIEVLWTIKPDGTSYSSFQYPNGNILTKVGTWEYSGSIITQIGTDGEIAKGSIEFANSNYFVVTILTNSDPGSAGLKRHYYRS